MSDIPIKTKAWNQNKQIFVAMFIVTAYKQIMKETAIKLGLLIDIAGKLQ